MPRRPNTNGNRFSRPHHPRRSSGQVLIFVVVLLLILLVITFFLFDLQTVIRLRAKTQNAADAAALTGAAWQARTLNLIGELNLLKGASVLLTEISPGEVPNAQRTAEDLRSAAALLTHMQARLSYVGPLLGLAAAQQAAKNNGMRVVPAYNAFFREHVAAFLDDAGGNLYRELYGDDPGGFSYAWRPSYQNLLEEVIAEGIAANPVNARILAGIPEVDGVGGFLLTDPDFYSAVYGFHYCWFYQRNIGPDHPPIEVDSMVYSRIPESYFPGSEFLPLYLLFADSATPGDAARDEMDAKGLEALPDDQPGLSEVRWAVYDPSGDGYGWAEIDLYHFMNQYLRSPFRREFTYSGACARMVTRANPPVLTGRWTWKFGQPEREEEETRLGRELGWSREEFGPDRSFATAARRLDEAEDRMAQLRRRHGVVSIASAKPFGSVSGQPPQITGMILPVFTDVRLVPVGVARSNPLSTDPELFRFIVEFFGHPNYPNVPDGVRERHRHYLRAIEIYNDTDSAFSSQWRQFDEWRTEFMAGEDQQAGTEDDRRDPCLPSRGGPGRGSRGGPGIIH